MYQLMTPEFGKKFLSFAVLLVMFGVGLGSTIHRQVCYLSFLLTEAPSIVAMLETNETFHEFEFSDPDPEGGKYHVFVFEAAAGSGYYSSRIVVTDDRYRITSSLDSDQQGELHRVGMLEGRYDTVLETVRYDEQVKKLKCNHYQVVEGMIMIESYDKANPRFALR